MELNYEDLKAAMESAVASAQTERVEVQDALAVQSAKIQELLDKLAGMGGGDGTGGVTMTQEQINDLVALALSIPAAVEAIYSPTEAPGTPTVGTQPVPPFDGTPPLDSTSA